MFVNISFRPEFSKFYSNIVSQKRIFLDDCYTETHHIIPRAISGSNDAFNLVKLTAREHFICHMLLVRMLSGNEKMKMLYALRALMQWKSKRREIVKINSKTYEFLKKKFSRMMKERVVSDEVKQKISLTKTGKPWTEARRKAGNPWEAARKAIKSHPGMTGKKHSNETKQKMSKSQNIRQEIARHQ